MDYVDEDELCICGHSKGSHSDDSAMGERMGMCLESLDSGHICDCMEFTYRHARLLSSPIETLRAGTYLQSLLDLFGNGRELASTLNGLNTLEIGHVEPLINEDTDDDPRPKPWDAYWKWVPARLKDGSKSADLTAGHMDFIGTREPSGDGGMVIRHVFPNDVLVLAGEYHGQATIR